MLKPNICWNCKDRPLPFPFSSNACAGCAGHRRCCPPVLTSYWYECFGKRPRTWEDARWDLWEWDVAKDHTGKSCRCTMTASLIMRARGSNAPGTSKKACRHKTACNPQEHVRTHYDCLRSCIYCHLVVTGGFVKKPQKKHSCACHNEDTKSLCFHSDMFCNSNINMWFWEVFIMPPCKVWKSF